MFASREKDANRPEPFPMLTVIRLIVRRDPGSSRLDYVRMLIKLGDLISIMWIPSKVNRMLSSWAWRFLANLTCSMWGGCEWDAIVLNIWNRVSGFLCQLFSSPDPPEVVYMNINPDSSLIPLPPISINKRKLTTPKFCFHSWCKFEIQAGCSLSISNNCRIYHLNHKEASPNTLPQVLKCGHIEIPSEWSLNCEKHFDMFTNVLWTIDK